MLFILTCRYVHAPVSQVFASGTRVFSGDHFWKCSYHNYSPLLPFPPPVYWFSEILCRCISWLVKHNSPPCQSLDHQCYQNTKTKVLVADTISDTGIPKALYTKLAHKLWKSHRLPGNKIHIQFLQLVQSYTFFAKKKPIIFTVVQRMLY